MPFIFETIGAAGLLCIATGVVLKKRRAQDIFYIVGGVLLTGYSIHIMNVIFILLQIVFTVAAIYDLVSYKKPTLPHH